MKKETKINRKVKEKLPLEDREAPPESKSPTVTNKASRALHPTFAP